MRAARRALSEADRLKADARILSHIRSAPVFRAARRIALFFAFDGEPDLSPLIRFDRRREFFAPVITPDEMAFATIGRDTRLTPNFYGIPEPVKPELIDPRALDLVLTPLVAFDRNGNRIGVGAGYYDRYFAFLRQRRHWFRPKLVGTAYALQQIEPVVPDSWDVPLWAVITEDGLSRFA
jgi:5-formyltetrahydrofolate cyclo-ligase